MTTITLTKIEHALLLGLLLNQDTRYTKPMTLTTDERELAAKLLRNFVGQLTCRLLGAPLTTSRLRKLALPAHRSIELDYLN